MYANWVYVGLLRACAESWPAIVCGDKSKQFDTR